MRAVKLIALFLFIFSSAKIWAQACGDFGGEYVNVTDPAKPELHIDQNGCKSLVLHDNAGIAWVIPLDGKEGTVPMAALGEFDDLKSIFTCGSSNLSQSATPTA